MSPTKLASLRKKYSYVLPSLPDRRDRIYVAGDTAIGKSASLREYRGPILDQKTWGSCTGHGTAGMLHSFFKRLTRKSIDFNPFWIWYWARAAIGLQDQNSGAYPRDIFSNLIHKGVCDKDEWVPESFNESPPDLTEDKIIKFKGYKRFDLGVSDFNQIKNDFFYCIGVEELPIGITMAVHSSFETYTKRTGELRMPTEEDSVIGYHWVYVDEVNDAGITVVNSWSEIWGDKGTCFMPWEYVDRFVVEAWSLDPELP